MRYYTTPKPTSDESPRYGSIYICDHPVYDRCTLFKENGIGLAIIQQYHGTYDKKVTWWDAVQPDISDMIYEHSGFQEYFNSKADKEIDGLYPTVTVRQIMWALRMKPLPREPWETVFDKSPI